MNKRGIPLVISGPSGCGKGTVIARLLKHPDFVYSVSATTRAPRPGEKDGVNYYFTDRDTFLSMAERGELLEYAEYVGNLYGTPRAPVEKALSEGKHVILELEVNGAANIKKNMSESTLVLIIPPDANTLERRLRDRGTEDESTVNARLAAARRELSFSYMYDYIVQNRDGEADAAAETIFAVTEAELASRKRNEELLNTFFKDN